MLVPLILSVALNLYLLYFIAKRYYYNRIPPVLWKYDIAMLGDSHIERGTWNKLLDLRVANFGKGKSTVEQMLKRLPGVINCKPSTCFVHGGINDIIREVPFETTIENYKRVVEGLREAGINPVVIAVMKTTCQKYCAYVDKLNAELKLLAPVIFIETVHDDFDIDGLHMTASGYTKWAAEIREYLKTNAAN